MKVQICNRYLVILPLKMKHWQIIVFLTLCLHFLAQMPQLDIYKELKIRTVGPGSRT